MNGNGSDMSDEQRRQALCDLMDGQASESEVQRACTLWQRDAQARADWHAYHVIGDVLRTPELVPQAHGDAAFLTALRKRLSSEPVVMAPTPLAASASPGRAAGTAAKAAFDAAVVVPASALPSNAVAHQHHEVALVANARRGAWRAPLAVAAGFMAVAGVVVVTRMGGLGGNPSAPMVVTAPAAAPPVTLAPASTKPTADTTAVMLVNDQRMVRDAALDRYLSAHRQFGADAAGAGGAMPGGVVRSVSTVAPDR